jgi:hypothetical protein
MKFIFTYFNSLIDIFRAAFKNYFSGFSGVISTVIWINLLFLPIIYCFWVFAEIQMNFDGNPTLLPEWMDSNYKQIISATFDPIQNGAERELRSESYFPFAEIVLNGKVKNIDPLEISYFSVISYRYDWMIVSLSLWFMLLYSARALSTSLRMAKESKKLLSEPLEIECNNKDSERQLTQIDVLREEVVYARKRAEDIYLKSTILLISGILMAFVGIFIFYLSLSDYSMEKMSANEFFFVSIRPATMLVFIEAIAWFLLRQYRILSEDSRIYHMNASRRSDLLTSFLAFPEEVSSEHRIFVLTNLLQSTQITTLKLGETTESLENSKLALSNPIFDMADRIISRLPEAHTIKKNND